MTCSWKPRVRAAGSRFLLPRMTFANLLQQTQILSNKEKVIKKSYGLVFELPFYFGNDFVKSILLSRCVRFFASP